MDKEKRELFAKALAYYLYREVVEDAHSDYNISQEDMFAMNTKSVNRAKLLVDILDDEKLLNAFILLYSLPVRNEWNNPSETEEVTEIANLIKDVSERGSIF